MNQCLAGGYQPAQKSVFRDYDRCHSDFDIMFNILVAICKDHLLFLQYFSHI